MFAQIIIRTLSKPGNCFDKPFCVTLTAENFLFLEGNSAHMFLWALGPGCELHAPWLWCPRPVFGELCKLLLLRGNKLSETLLHLLYPTSQASRYCLANQELYASSLQVLSLRGYFGDLFFTPVPFPFGSAVSPSSDNTSKVPKGNTIPCPRMPWLKISLMKET